MGKVAVTERGAPPRPSPNWTPAFAGMVQWWRETVEPIRRPGSISYP